MIDTQRRQVVSAVQSVQTSERLWEFEAVVLLLPLHYDWMRIRNAGVKQIFKPYLLLLDNGSVFIITDLDPDPVYPKNLDPDPDHKVQNATF